METLKFSILTLLIPLGWLLSEAQAVYPQSVEQIDNAGDLKLKPHHLARHLKQPNIGDADTRSRCVLQTVATHVALVDRKGMHQDRVFKPDACHFNLELIEID